VCHLLAPDGANFVSHQSYDRNSLTVQGDEFDFMPLSTSMNQHDRSDISRAQAMFWQIAREDHLIKFLYRLHPVLHL
jgi:hypothetical protein